MKKQLIGIFLVSLVMLFSAISPAEAQKSTRSNKVSNNAKIGDRYLETNEFSMAADYYMKALRSNTGDMYAQYKLAEAYENMLQYAKAEAGYQRVLQSRNKNFPLLAFRYGNMLKVNGKYDEAKKQFESFIATFKPAAPEEQIYADQARVELKGCELAIKEMTRENPDYLFRLLPAPVNSNKLDFAPAIWDNDSTLVLTSNRPDARGGTNDPVLGGSFTDFFAFTKKGANWAEFISKDGFEFLNSKLAEGAGVFNAKKDKFYYTNCAGEDQCQIFVVSKEKDGKWGNPVALNNNINMAGYSSKQPTLTAKGDTLFFVSNRPGGLGANDIWYSVNRGSDAWDNAVNLGEAVNTPFNDMAPFYYPKEQLLFFASNGREGFGGLDVFMASGKDFDKVINIGIPFNSNRDDFYFIQGDKYGYITSNREGGIGGDDIYSFQYQTADANSLKNSIEKKDSIAKAKANPVAQLTEESKDVTGQVMDKDTKKAMPDTEVELVDENGRPIKSTKTDKDGNYAFRNLPDNRNYNVKKKPATNKGNSKNNSKALAAKNAKNGTGKGTGKNGKGGAGNKGAGSNTNDAAGSGDDMEVAMSETKVKKPSTRFLYENIYFDFDSDELRPEAKQVLNEIISYSKENEGIQVEMNAYTDNIGTTDYNKKLSARRGENAKSYLQENGMEATKFVVKSLGESKFLASNSNPTGRLLNRRVEFYILGGTQVKGQMVYISESSENLADIASKFGMSVEELKQLNGITSDEVTAFQPLRVTRNDGAGVVSRATMALSGKASQVTPELGERKRASAEATALTLDNGSYTVEAGQTLYSISRLFGLTVDEANAMNPQLNGQISKGVKMKITPKKRRNYYEVKAGESLNDIAKRNGTTAERIITANRMDFYPLYVGMQLRLR